MRHLCCRHGEALHVSLNAADLHAWLFTRQLSGSVAYRRANGAAFACNRLHFRRIMFDWTDPSLGNCSYLDTCRHMNKCKFIHYELDDSTSSAVVATNGKGAKPAVPAYLQVLRCISPSVTPSLTPAAVMLCTVASTVALAVSCLSFVAADCTMLVPGCKY